MSDRWGFRIPLLCKSGSQTVPLGVLYTVLSVIRNCTVRGAWAWVWVGNGMYKWPFDISRVLVEGSFSFQHFLSLMTSNGAVRSAYFQLHLYF